MRYLYHMRNKVALLRGTTHGIEWLHKPHKVQKMNQSKFDSRLVLWNNLSALMQKHFGGENLNLLARTACVSPGTTARIKAQQTSVGLETLDRFAAAFGVSPNELIDPAFTVGGQESAMSEHEATPGAAPNKALSPIALDLAQALDAIGDQSQQERVYAFLMHAIEFGTGQTATAPASVASKPVAPTAQQYVLVPIESLPVAR